MERENAQNEEQTSEPDASEEAETVSEQTSEVETDANDSSVDVPEAVIDDEVTSDDVIPPKQQEETPAEEAEVNELLMIVLGVGMVLAASLVVVFIVAVIYKWKNQSVDPAQRRDSVSESTNKSV